MFMNEERWGEAWRVGMRVKIYNKYETPGQMRHGVIVDRSWGRDRGKPIYWFTVQIDDIKGSWVFGPGQLLEPDE